MKRLNRKNKKQTDYIKNLIKYFDNSPIPKNEILENLFLYLTKKDFSHLIFLNDLYKKIINTHGNIYEFGTRWGRNLSIFTLLRGIYEPYNYTRKVLGFDTFLGFPKSSLHKKDGNHQTIEKGSYNVTKKYENYLEKLLTLKNSELPIEHIKKFELLKGDAVKKAKDYFKKNKHELVALAYFDLDLYSPTKELIKLILPRTVGGSILLFDELNHQSYPGETTAFLEQIISKNKFKLYRSEISASKSYIIIEKSKKFGKNI
tara:strand:- start:14 stop:793 length:780 start_codon:yes stop_codon:yes gene_type:complete